MSGGTNRKIEQQNKMVRKQFKSDMRMHDYTRRVNEDRYDAALAKRDLQQATLDARADAADKIKKQDFRYKTRLQNRQFKVDKEAYRQGLKDYDRQVELNSMSGAIALEAAQRANEEALITKNFDLEGQRIQFQNQQDDLTANRAQLAADDTFAAKSHSIDSASIASKLKAATESKAVDDREYSSRVTFAKDSAQIAENKLGFQKDKLDNDIGFLQTSEGWDLRGAKIAYEKQQVPNFNKRIDLIIEREKATGMARASGREGLSAQREVTSALAKYGREQAQLVDELVFSQDDRSLSEEKTVGTTTYNVGQKNIDKSVVDENITMNTLQRNRNVESLLNEKAKIDIAFADTAVQLGLDQQRVDATFAKQKSESTLRRNRLNAREETIKDQNFLNEQQIKTTFDSANAQFEADKNKIKLDEVAANIRAQGQIPARPKKPIPLPKPIATVRTKLPLPTAPVTAPRPIKGSIQQTSIWNDVGDAANLALSIGSLFL